MGTEPAVDNKGRVIRGRGIKNARREVPSGGSTRALVERRASGKMSISLSKARRERVKRKPYDKPSPAGMRSQSGQQGSASSKQQPSSPVGFAVDTCGNIVVDGPSTAPPGDAMTDDA